MPLSTRAGIDVRGGQFTAHASAGKPVTLTSYYVDPTRKRTPIAGDWAGISVSGATTAVDMSGVSMRYCADAIRFQHPQGRPSTLRGLRISDCATTGIRLDTAQVQRLQGCVVERAMQGIVISGVADVENCSVLNSTTFGITKGSRALVKVYNSIVWGSGRQNYNGFVAGDVFNSVGGFDGKNGNLDKDPRLDSNQRPRADSPVIDRGDSKYLRGATQDGAFRPRTLDGKLNGSFEPDIGAYEYSPWTSRSTGDWTPGGRITVEIPTGPSALAGHFLGFGGPVVTVAPLGTLNSGLAGFLTLTWLSTQQKMLLPVPNDPKLKGVKLFLQPLVLASLSPVRGHFLEVHEIEIQ